MMTRRRPEIPHPRFARSGKQAVSNKFIAGPFADDCARDVTDVVLVETEHRAEARLCQRFSGSRKPVSMQAPEVDALFEIDLRRTGRLKRPVPAVVRLEVVFVNRQKF